MVQDTLSQHVIKRYGLARLYDTTTAAYVDVAQLRALGRAGASVMVIDAKTGDDITSALLWGVSENGSGSDHLS